LALAKIEVRQVDEAFYTGTLPLQQDLEDAIILGVGPLYSCHEVIG
jgi:hypothetical protein